MDPKESGVLAPFHAAISLLSPFLPPSNNSQQLSPIDTAIKSAHERCTELSTNSSPDTETINSFKEFLAKKFLNFKVPPSAFVTPDQEQRDKTSSTHGPQPQSQEGYKVVAIVHVLDALLDGLTERTGEREGKWWYQVGEGILQGLALHLDLNDVGKKTAQDLAYRIYLCSQLTQSLVRLIVPDPSELPKSSADNMKGLGKDLTEMATKYLALDVLGQLLSKNEVNKSVVGDFIKPEHLGSILHSAFDHHLSQMSFELAFRLLPPKRSPDARRKYLAELFSEDVFGQGKEDLAKRLRSIMDGIEMKIEGGWENGVTSVLKLISDTHIRRSQYFKAVSIEYNSQQLLLPNQRDSLPSPKEPPTSISRIVEEGYYESQLLWISRHILAASLPVEANGEESIERLVIPLSGIEKVFVNLVDQVPNAIRLTLLLKEKNPLLLNSVPHSSSPSHTGVKFVARTETQVDEQQAVAGSDVRKYHKLVVLIKLEESTLKTLKETLRDRGKQYSQLSKELSDFPHRAAQPVAATKASTRPSLSESTASNNRPRPDIPAHSARLPLPTVPIVEEVPDQGQRRVTFASDTLQHDSQKKVSDVENPVESRAGATERDGPRKGRPSRGEAAGEEKREEPLSDEGEPMLDGSDQEEKGEEKSNGKTSQKVIEERKETVASMAELEQDVASRGGGGRGSSTQGKRSSSTTKESTSSKQQKEEPDSIEQADSPAKSEGTTHARSTTSTSTKKEAVAPMTSRSTRSGVSRKGNQENKEKGGNKEEQEDEQESKHDGGESKRSTRVPQVSKKVVAARKVDQKKPEVVAPKGKKRIRSASSDEQDKEEAALSDADSAGSDGADLLPPEAIGTVKTKVTKKVVKSKNSDSSEPTSKRRKPSPSLADIEEQHDTDYENYPSLEPKPAVANPSKKYGNQKKSIGKVNGNAKKAGKGKRAIVKKRDESDEEADEEGGKQDKKQKSTTTKVARSMAKKKVVSPSKKKELSDDVHESDQETNRGTRRSPRLRKTRAQVAKAEKTTKQSSESIKANQSKRQPEPTPPPFDMQPGLARKNKLSTHVATSETASASIQAKKTFNELLKEPDDNVVEDENNLDTGNQEGGDQRAERSEDDDLGGYEFNQVEDVEIANEEAEPQVAIPRSPAVNTNDKAASLSPVVNPATTDLSFVDQAFAGNDREGANGASLSATTPARKATVLVDDTPVASGAQQEKKQVLTLGAHEISSQRAKDGNSSRENHDVDMEDVGKNEESKKGAFEMEEIEERREEREANVAFGLADDSGIHLDASMDQGFEGGDERSVQNDEEFDNQSQPEENVNQVERRQIAQNVPRAPINTRPLLVPRQARIQPTVNLARPPPQQTHRYAPPPLPVSSRHSASVAHPPVPLGSQASRPVQSAQSSRRHTLAPTSQRQTLASTSRQRPSQAVPIPRVNPASTRRIQQPQARPDARRVSRGGRPPIVQLDVPSSSPSISTYDDNEGGRRLNDQNRNVLDPEDQEYFETLNEFSELMTLKNQQRRRERQDHYANSQARFEEPLVKFLNSVLQDTAEIVDSARGLSIQNKLLDPNPAQKLLAGAMAAQERNDRLWNDIQQHVEKRSSVTEGNNEGKK